MTKNKVRIEADDSYQSSWAFDMLGLMGALGMRKLRSKIFFFTLSLAALSLIVACLIACWSYSSTLNSAGSAAPAGVSVFGILLETLPVLIIPAVLSYVFASSVSKAARSLLSTTQYVRAGDLMARAHVTTSDEFEEVGNGFNDVMTRLSKTIEAEQGQKQALLLISQAVDNSGDGIAIRDFIRGTAHFNKTFSELLGSSGEDLDRAEANLGIFNDSATARDVLDLLDRGGSWNGEIELRTRSGRAVPVSLRANAIKDNSGKVIGRIAIYTDVSDRKRMEEVMMNSEEQYRSLFDLNPNPMWVYDVASLRILAVNASAVAQYEYSREEMLHLTITDISASKDQPDLREPELKAASAEGPPVSIHKTKSGATLYVETASHSVTFGGRAAKLLQAKDVTERIRMEEALRKSENEYRALFESANDPILIFDPHTEELLEVNHQACLTYGFDRHELVGMSLKGLTKDITRGEQLLKQALNGGTTEGFETVHIRKDGKPISIVASTSVIEYHGKQAILGIARDVTARKQAEEILERSLNDFLRLVSIVSEGDLTGRGDNTEGPLAAFSAALNRMLDNFSGMLTRVKQIGLSVTSSATEILAASEQIAAGAQRQADEITNTSSAVEEMAASMSQVSRNAEASAESARRALDMAENGDRAVKDTSQAMGRINQAVQGTAEKMRLLAKRSSEISEIIDLINDVAAQTNLLSLNAAIEAAHAGEAGLGFSVVAEEIRKLAERSARATRDVGALIKAIQNETSEALDAMENGMKEVRDGSTLAEQARQSLQDISHTVRQSAELIEEISAASEEQARVTRNLAGAMQTVSSITLETSAGAHETAQTIQGMVSLSEQLNEGISRFKVKENQNGQFPKDGGNGHAGGSGPRFSGYQGADSSRSVMGN
ncbi:MAG TPA: methyl-accepting chemotaxis protein [Blastocatellia bacterium]